MFPNNARAHLVKQQKDNRFQGHLVPLESKNRQINTSERLKTPFDEQV
jgi:hypothetical protein